MSQLIIAADMEGASGIFEKNRKWMMNGGDEWREHGRECITSDVLAVANAAVDFGIDDILLYDAHFAGNTEFNVILEKLPPAVRVFDIPDRCMFWRRIRGQAALRPFGLITVGQHARYGVPADVAYFPHTIQSPPLKSFFCNGIHVAEIGMAVLNFDDTPYLANIGDAASMGEALELSGKIVTVPVKDKAKGWEPSPAETYPLIYAGTTQALKQADKAEIPTFGACNEFYMEVCDGYRFDTSAKISWKGTVNETRADWTAPSLEIGLELFHYVRDLIRKL